ncbi:MAG: hypothetical protein ACLPN5_17170 [Roseiarcus sp.]
MTLPVLISSQNMADLEAKRARESSTSHARAAGSGGGPTGNDMERRVSALEKAYEKIDGKLDKIVDQSHAADLRLEGRFNTVDIKLTSVDAKLDAKASAATVSEIAGRVSDLPSKWFVGTTAIAVLFGASAFISAVLVYLEKLRLLLGAH